jgi:hypothetical protein
MIASAMSTELEYTNLCYTNDTIAHTVAGIGRLSSTLENVHV